MPSVAASAGGEAGDAGESGEAASAGVHDEDRRVSVRVRVYCRKAFVVGYSRVCMYVWWIMATRGGVDPRTCAAQA